MPPAARFLEDVQPPRDWALSVATECCLLPPASRYPEDVQPRGPGAGSPH